MSKQRPVLAGCQGLLQGMRFGRRGFLQIGNVSVLGTGLLSALPSRLAANDEETPARAAKFHGRAKACILLFQVGGPYQCDTFDPKPDSPEEVRGPFKPIATSAPGMWVTDQLPNIARQADKFAILRSVHHTIRCHNPAIYCSLVGREATDPMAVSNRTAAKRDDHPHYASVLAKLRAFDAPMPAHVIVPDVVYNGPARSPGLLAGYLGAAYDPFIVQSEPSDPGFHVEGVGLPHDIGSERFSNRRSLLQQVDSIERDVDRAGGVALMDTFYRKAFEVLTSARTKEAFHLDREPAALRDRYGRHAMGQGALLARRLVESGVPFVTVFSHTHIEKESWDTHQKHYETSKTKLLPPADQSLAALLEDMSNRGLLDDCLVLWMGEFGRTPKMGVNFSNNTNNVGGRDHWCNCYSVVAAGGGVQGGRVVGSSDRIGGYPADRPVHIGDLAATIYSAFGIDYAGTVRDIQGIPKPICTGQPVTELLM